MRGGGWTVAINMLIVPKSAFPYYLHTLRRVFTSNGYNDPLNTSMEYKWIIQRLQRTASSINAL